MQREVARLCLEDEIEQVADDRNRADRRIDRDIAQHVELDHARRAQLARDMHRVDGDHATDDVTEPGYEPEQRVKTEPPFRPGHAERLIHEARQRAQPDEAGLAATFELGRVRRH